MNTDALILLGIGLVLIGIVLVFVGALLTGGEDSDVQAGGVVFIGPIPIVFGSSKKMAGLSLLLGIVVFIAYLLYWR